MTAQAARTPDAVAVTCGDVRVSYGELTARAGRLARVLAGAGAGPDTAVGLCLDRGPDMLTAILATWLTGAAYLPLDPAHPAERTAFMLADSRAVAVVRTAAVLAELPSGQARPTVAGTAAELPSGQVRLLALDDPQVAAAVAAGPAAVRARAGQLAYVMYTSGSTGTPKGVAVTHGGLVNYLSWAAAAYRAGPGAGAPLHSSLAFDLTVTSALVPLLTGAMVTASPDGGAQGAAALLGRGTGSGCSRWSRRTCRCWTRWCRARCWPRYGEPPQPGWVWRAEPVLVLTGSWMRCQSARPRFARTAWQAAGG